MFNWFKKKKKNDPFDVLSGLLSLQLIPTYTSIKDSFGSLMTNNEAAGYVFGFYDSFLQNMGLSNPSDPEVALALVESNYKKIFGEQAGYALFSKSLACQEDAEFHRGRLEGGNEFHEYLTNKTPALGLSRILVLKQNSEQTNEEENLLSAFEKETESWPEHQALAAIKLLKSTLGGDGFLEKYYGELTVSQIKRVSKLLDEMEEQA